MADRRENRIVKGWEGGWGDGEGERRCDVVATRSVLDQITNQLNIHPFYLVSAFSFLTLLDKDLNTSYLAFD